MPSLCCHSPRNSLVFQSLLIHIPNGLTHSPLSFLGKTPIHAPSAKIMHESLSYVFV